MCKKKRRKIKRKKREPIMSENKETRDRVTYFKIPYNVGERSLAGTFISLLIKETYRPFPTTIIVIAMEINYNRYVSPRIRRCSSRILVETVAMRRFVAHRLATCC